MVAQRRSHEGKGGQEMKMHKKIMLDLPVRFRDIDSMGHVNNAVFFTYFEEGRKVFLSEIFKIMAPSDYNFILARIGCEFHRAVTLSDPLTLELWIGGIGQKSFTLKYRILCREDDSIVYATGESVQVFYDYESGATRKLTESFLDKIAPYVERAP
jgi:acyl-CoA thioester hydrolase